jgi:ribulose-phosphate 3-epimerase
MARNIRIIPAILTNDPQILKAMLEQTRTFTDYVQIDIMDGRFVPSRSVTWQQLSGIAVNINWEAHLMVEQPEEQLEHFKEVGAGKVIFHFEAAPDPLKVISTARKLGLKIGLALNPETPVERILSITGQLDSVLFMAVHPGFYGAKFIPEVLDKIAELRKNRPNLKIGVDGGIKEGNIAQIAKSGVDEICVGSAIFLQPQPGESYRKLLEQANR